MSRTSKRFFMWALFLFGIALLFLPIRVDHVTQLMEGDTPDTLTYVDTNQDFYCSAFVGFNGHPVGIVLILLFALTPFFVVAQSFSIKRPFSFASTTLLRLEALVMFVGGPYVWYAITYEHGYFSNTIHTTDPAWAGWLLIAYIITSGILLYAMLAAPKSKLAALLFEAR